MTENVAVLTPAEQEALLQGLPCAWPLLDQFAAESEGDDARLAAGMAEYARILRSLYERLAATQAQR